MNFQEAYKSVETVDKNLSFHENMVNTMFQVWFVFPEHRPTVEKSVKAHVSVERGLKDKLFTNTFNDIIS